jgi:hypothetical protein
MKKIVSLLILIVLITMSFAFRIKSDDPTDNALARVSKVNGRYVFYHNEPVNHYEIAFTFKDGIKNFDCNTVESNMNEAVKNANMEAGQQGKLYDALVIGTGDRDMAITFPDKEKENGIARVKREGGLYLFLGCEPMTGYDVLKKIDVSGEGWKAMTGKCPNWEWKIEKLLKKTGKEKNNCDAVILGDTKWDYLIKFHKYYTK